MAGLPPPVLTILFMILTTWDSLQLKGGRAEALEVVNGSLYILDPDCVTDMYGNVADNQSVINWVASPRGVAYQSSAAYSSEGLGPLIQAANTFINVVQPNAFPFGGSLLFILYKI